jgi:hypothetical protein
MSDGESRSAGPPRGRPARSRLSRILVVREDLSGDEALHYGKADTACPGTDDASDLSDFSESVDGLDSSASEDDSAHSEREPWRV